MLEELDPLARTALWTASLRGREQQRPDRLFYDPLAAVLGGDVGERIMTHFEERVLDGAEDPALAIRTRFFDAEMSRVIQQCEVRQVVLVAAGMDTRAFRLEWPVDVRVFELDKPALLATKDALLTRRGVAPSCQRTPVGVDLLGRWRNQLNAAGFRSDLPTLWLVEGLLYFLTESQRDQLLAEIRAESGPSSWFLADYVSHRAITSTEMRGWLAEMEREGHPWLSGCDDPRSLFGSYGWRTTVVEYGAPAADFGRWRQARRPDVPTTGGRYLVIGVDER